MHDDIGEVLGLHGSGDEMASEAGRVFSGMDTNGDHHIGIDEFVQFFGTVGTLKAAAALQQSSTRKRGTWRLRQPVCCGSGEPAVPTGSERVYSTAR